MPAFQLAVALRIVRAGPHMGHAHQADEGLEIPRDELRPIVADNPRGFTGELLQGPLHDRFHLLFFHCFPQFPMHDGAAAAIQQRTEKVKRAADIDVANVDMPVFVR